MCHLQYRMIYQLHTCTIRYRSWQYNHCLYIKFVLCNLSLNTLEDKFACQRVKIQQEIGSLLTLLARNIEFLVWNCHNCNHHMKNRKTPKKGGCTQCDLQCLYSKSHPSRCNQDCSVCSSNYNHRTFGSHD